MTVPGTPNPEVDPFFEKAAKWRAEFLQLRAIVLRCGLAEQLKWGQPCYTLEGRNVVLIHGFKDYCALLFMKGALLRDEAGLLVRQTENVQSARQLRFTSLGAVKSAAKDVTALVRQAIEVEKSGRKVERKTTAEFTMPEELRQRFREDPAFRSAFEALIFGWLRGFLLLYSGAKQSRTRAARIEKAVPRIFDGMGLDD